MTIYQNILKCREGPEQKNSYVDPGKEPQTNTIITFAKAQSHVWVGQVNRWILAPTLKGGFSIIEHPTCRIKACKRKKK